MFLRVFRVIEGLSAVHWLWGLLGGTVTTWVSVVKGLELDEAILLGIASVLLVMAIFTTLRSRTRDYQGLVVEYFALENSATTHLLRLRVPGGRRSDVFKARVTRIGVEADLLSFPLAWVDGEDSSRIGSLPDEDFVNVAHVLRLDKPPGLSVLSPIKPGPVEHDKVPIYSPRVVPGTVEMTVLMTRESKKRSAEEVDLLVGIDTMRKPICRVTAQRKVSPRDR